MANKKEDAVSDIQRNAIAAQWSFDASIKAYEAAAISGNQDMLNQTGAACHNCLDALLACKQALFKEHLNTDFKFM